MYGNLVLKRDYNYFPSEGLTTISAGGYVDVVPAVPPKPTIDAGSAPMAWHKETVQRLKQLVELKPNWDSYGAKPISERLAQTTLQILEQLMRTATPRPSIVPTPSGHIQVEWHTKGIDLEVEIVSPILIRVAFEDQQTGDEWEEDLNVDLRPLKKILSTLAER